MKIRAVTLFGAIVACACCMATQPDNDALHKLLRALDSQRDVEATLIQVRQLGEQSITVKTQTVPGRGIRSLIIMPTFYAGIVSFDDGEKYRRYDPTQSFVAVENSPERYKFDIAFREKLIEKNYAVKFEEDSQIAKRKVKVVFMKGLVSGIADRRLYIDANNDMILRYELMRTGEELLTPINTLHVDLWVKEGADFSKVGLKNTRQVISKSPVKVSSVKSAENYVSFLAVIPTGLTAGLEKQAMHVVHHRETKFLAIRLTDGMAFITVYLYKSKQARSGIGFVAMLDSQLPMYGNKHAEAKDGLRCWVVGDADEALKERLAKRFIRAYDGTIGRTRNNLAHF